MGFQLAPLSQVLNAFGGTNAPATQQETTSTGGSTVGLNLNNPNIKDASSFSVALLTTLGNDLGKSITASPQQIALVNAWQSAEGQWNAIGQFNASNQHNPLNIESTAPGSPKGTKICDSAGNCTLSFSTWQQGLQATADFIRHYQPEIGSALLSSSNPTNQFFSVVGKWNPTNPNYAESVAAQVGATVPGGTGTGSSSSQTTGNGWLYTYAQDLAAPGGLFGGLNVAGDIRMVVARGGTFVAGFVVFLVGLLIIVGGSITNLFKSSVGRSVKSAVTRGVAE